MRGALLLAVLCADGGAALRAGAAAAPGASRRPGGGGSGPRSAGRTGAAADAGAAPDAAEAPLAAAMAGGCGCGSGRRLGTAGDGDGSAERGGERQGRGRGATLPSRGTRRRLSGVMPGPRLRLGRDGAGSPASLPSSSSDVRSRRAALMPGAMLLPRIH
jgi:hypothetical protein